MIVNHQKVTAFQLTLILTEDEMRRMMVDAEEFQAKLREILNEYTGEKYMKHLNGSNGKTNPKGITPPNSNHGRGERVPCKICDRLITSHFMNKHLKTHAKDSVAAARLD